MRALNYPKNISPSFKKRANEAAFWEAWVGAVLSRAGLYTLHHPFVADGGDYHALSWDLEVGTWSALVDEYMTKLECKGVSLTFTVPEDYPFPKALICSANNWNKKWPDKTLSQRDFVIVSTTTGAILWIPVGTPATVVTVTDKSRAQTYKAMQCDASYLKPLSDFVEKLTSGKG